MASHPRKFIVQPTEEDLKKYPEKIRHLVKKGREQRYVTHQEIIAAVPNAEENVELLDEIYTLFVDLGVEVIDVKDILIWEKKGKESVMKIAEPAEDLTEIVSEDTGEEVTDELDEEDDTERSAGKMSDDEDEDVMQVVATAGIAIDEKELNAEQKLKPKKKP